MKTKGFTRKDMITNKRRNLFFAVTALFALVINAGQSRAVPEAISELFADPTFLRGATVSIYQNAGARSIAKFFAKSNWQEFSKAEGIFKESLDETWKTARENYNDFDIIEDFDKEEPDTIKRLKKLGANSFRFSIEWTMFQPDGPDSWNEDAVIFYKKLLKKLNDNNITPIATLHHFVHPQWFDNKGGFATMGNNGYFVAYAKKVLDLFGAEIPIWVSFNEPGIYTFCGYLFGVHAPGKYFAQDIDNIIPNMMDIHNQIYRHIKRNIGLQHIKFGIIHNPFVFDTIFNYGSHHKSTFGTIAPALSFVGPTPLLIPVLIGAAAYAGVKYVLDSANHYSNELPLKEIVANKKNMDFLGINYYGDFHVMLNKDQSRSAMHWVIDPYRFKSKLIDIYSKTELPIYITENGLPEGSGIDQQTFFENYLLALAGAKNAGVDVRGYMAWTLIDNWEWAEGYGIKFGLFGINKNNKIFLRSGAGFLSKVYGSR